ncbi:cytochrome P450 [Lentinula aciculospora]|uniref:Cytochrome P450 n=1 Tax=Lentinula aciculospora TaxID=153920 RepID=A0A9W9ALC9_9AGAR|nr:cytochrome P450 [Lentinula aciculospora]
MTFATNGGWRANCYIVHTLRCYGIWYAIFDLSWQGDLVYLPYGNALKAHRKLFHQEFQPSNFSIRRPHHKKALRLFLNHLIDTPEEWLGHVKHFEYRWNTRRISRGKCNGLLPRYFVLAKSWYGIRDATITPLFIQVKQAMAKGTAADCFSLRCLANAQNPDPSPDRLSEEEEMIKQTAGTMYEGSADTGITILRTFILAMMCFPDAQRETQEELDRVVGKEQLPDYEDLDGGNEGLSRLPYVWAVIFEFLIYVWITRWQPVVPLFIPHLVNAEDTYKGYYIPKGSTIIPNVWSILRDERTYGPTAHTFDPKRWLLQERTNERGDSEAEARWKFNHDMPEPLTITFGFGRREAHGDFIIPNEHCFAPAFL